MNIHSHEVINAEIAEPDGSTRTCPIIVIDKEETGYTGAQMRDRKGYIPRRERGAEQGITPDDKSEVFYEPATFVNGSWVLAGPDDRGVRSYITSGSGNGELYQALEQIRSSGAQAV